MKSKTKILGAAAAVYLGLMGAETLSAKAAWVKQAKDAGFPATNCLYCHTEKLPKKEQAKEQLNDRGKWLVAQMAKHNTKEVDVTWLKDYPGGNNHGSLAQLNGQWYIFYHRMTNRTVYSRIACVEKVAIEPDGSIKEVEMTSLGFHESLDPFAETSAHLACVLTGGNYISESDDHAMPVVGNKAGAVIGYKYFRFPAAEGTAAAKPIDFTAQIRSRPGPGKIEIWTDAVDTGTKLGELDLSTKPTAASSRPGEIWTTVSTRITTPTAGRKALYLRFTGASGQDAICDLRSFRFSPVE